MSQLEFDFSDVHGNPTEKSKAAVLCARNRVRRDVQGLSEVASALGEKKEMFFNKNKNKYQEFHLEQAIKITKMEWGMDIK